MKRQYKEVQTDFVGFRLEPSLNKLLDAECAKQGKPKSQLIKEIIIDYLKKPNKMFLVPEP